MDTTVPLIEIDTIYPFASIFGISVIFITYYKSTSKDHIVGIVNNIRNTF